MREFIIFYLIGLTASVPQSYSYATQRQHTEYGPVLSFNEHNDLNSNANVQLRSVESVANSEEAIQNGIQHQPRYLAPTLENNLLPPKKYNSDTKSIVTKRFFIHSAPEETDDEVKETLITLGKPKKNYNIVFIKTPVKAVGKTSVKITPAINEEKTVIYVLSKKSEDHEIEAYIHEPVSTTSKPDVFFIKYKTPEEASHAQQTIQAQFDYLGGTTQISHEGVPNQSSVIGALNSIEKDNDYNDRINADLSIDQHTYKDTIAHSGTPYLPPVTNDFE